MALVTLDDQPGGGRGLVLYDPTQRQRAMKAARRHSVIVRIFRLLLPLAAVILLGGYVISLQMSTKISDDINEGTFRIGSIDLLSTKPTMRNPTYTGFNKKDGTEYTVRADKAVTDLDETKPIDLFGITATVKQTNGTSIVMTAKEGQFERNNHKLDLSKKIVIRTSDGMAAGLTEATIYTRKGLIRSPKPVAVRFSAGTLRGDTMILRQKKRQVDFRGNVVANLQPAKQSGHAGKPAARRSPRPTGTGLAGLTGQSSDPVKVRAPRLRIDDTVKTARFAGGVKAVQGEARLAARFLDVEYTGTTTGGSGESAAVKRLHARQKVVITRPGDRIATDLATFDVERNIAELSGGVVINSGKNRRIMSDKAYVDSTRDYIRLTGQVIATQGDSVLRGTNLEVDQKRGLMTLTNPLEKNGRVKARFVDEDAEQAAKDKQKKATARKAKANSNPLAGQTFTTTPGAPVEVEATRLDVDDTKRLATFRGKVRAVQGDFAILTDVLHITYTGGSGLAITGPSTTAAHQPGAATKIKSIVAPGRIKVESPGGQSAAGDSGEFDFEKNAIVLKGDIVVTRGRQLVRGENLYIDLTSGLSRIETGAAWNSRTSDPNGRAVTNDPKAAAKIADPANRRACGGRMCAVFFPADLKNGAANKKSGSNATSATTTQKTVKTPDAKASSIGNSWSVSTTPNANDPSSGFGEQSN